MVVQGPSFSKSKSERLDRLHFRHERSRTCGRESSKLPCRAMSGPRFEEAARLYWAALDRRDALPELPEDSFDAFVELLHLGAEAQHAFRLVELEPSPYSGILLTDRQKNWSLEWAIGLAELEPFVLASE